MEKLTLTCDVRLARRLAEFNVESPPPLMWNEFDALARVPVLVIRGSNSDIPFGRRSGCHAHSPSPADGHRSR